MYTLVFFPIVIINRMVGSICQFKRFEHLFVIVTSNTDPTVLRWPI